MRGWRPNAGSRPGAGLVLITFGSRGAWAADRDARVHAPAPAVRVVDTVGAGDAFTAGALAHRHRTGRLSREGVDHLGAGELARLLSYAVEIAADTCTRADASRRTATTA
ncbi:PfkB family carbohydrate kinase [Streptomyces collinus]|uniref:PfkB family carbohydrate kinase n=1 Tax=Streptomyces collinus TaxID=42684 RepID=UPI00342C1AA2